MTDKPDVDHTKEGLDPTVEDQKQTRLNAIGFSTGAAALALLRENNMCTCLACQTCVLEAQIRWVCHGEPVDHVRMIIADLAMSLYELQEQIAQQEAAAGIARDMGPSPSSSSH